MDMTLLSVAEIKVIVHVMNVEELEIAKEFDHIILDQKSYFVKKHEQSLFDSLKRK